MRRSKLEMHIDILKILAQRGPLKITHIMYKVNINFGFLREDLDFLIKHNMVEERIVDKKRKVYAITDRGRTVLSYFRQMKTMLPIGIEEPSKFPVQLM